jgi:predicted permease
VLFRLSESVETTYQLGWRSAWNIAGKIAFEVQFRSAMEMNRGAISGSAEKQIQKARNNAKFNKAMVCIFTGVFAAVFGFIVWGVVSGVISTYSEYTWIMVATTVSLFALMSLGFLLFWGIMVSTSFISSGAASIGLYLPLSRSDAGKIALLGYIRLFDAQIITIIITFPLAYLLATGSALGTLACLGIFLVGVGISITLMLLLAIYFYTRIQASGGSRLGSIIRIVFILLWAVAIMGFSLSLQLLNFILPVIESFAIALYPIWDLLSIVYPFALGTLVVQATGITGTPFIWTNIVASAFYAFLAIIGIRWGARFLVDIGIGQMVMAGPSVIRPVDVKVSRISVAMIRKDLRIALRTPGQAVMFFLPVLMVVPIILQFLGESGAIHVLDVIMLCMTPSFMLAFFAIFFLGIEARGMGYTLTLPLKTETILRSKAQLITCMSIAIPIIVVLLSLVRPFTTPLSYAIAISQIPIVYVSSFIALVLFTRIIGGGRLVGFELSQHVSHMVGVGFISAIFTFIPLGLYGLSWLHVSLLALPIEFAHLAGLGGLWLGIAFDHLVGKLIALKMLHD